MRRGLAARLADALLDPSRPSLEDEVRGDEHADEGIGRDQPGLGEVELSRECGGEPEQETQAVERATGAEDACRVPEGPADGPDVTAPRDEVEQYRGSDRESG